MVNFKLACMWLRSGKKITRPNWDESSYWVLGPDEMICYADGSHAKIHLEQFNGTDWKIWEKDCLSDNRIKFTWNEPIDAIFKLKFINQEIDYGLFSKDNVKKFIKRRINDLHDINNGSITPSQALAKLKMEAGEGLI